VYILEFKQAGNDNRKEKISGYRNLALAGLVGQQTVRSGVPRALGVRLESHSTSKKTAKQILKNGGFLDPQYGGSGAARISSEYTDASKNYIHITGRHKKDKIMAGIKEGPVKNLLNTAHRKLQRGMYRGIQGQDLSGSEADRMRNVVKGLPAGLLGLKGKTLYVGGTNKFFDSDRFIPDSDDVALKTNKKLKVSGSRLGATVEAIKKEGLGNLLKDSKGRVATGLGILGGGGLLTGALANSAVNKIRGKKKLSDKHKRSISQALKGKKRRRR
jgi:hypothetical protein